MKSCNYSREDTGIVRNKLKIQSVVTNAKAFLNIQKEYGSFWNYIWSFVDNEPIVNHWETVKEVPVSSDISDYMSKRLKKDGFKFVPDGFVIPICRLWEW